MEQSKRTDNARLITAFKWLITEMERRKNDGAHFNGMCYIVHSAGKRNQRNLLSLYIRLHTPPYSKRYDDRGEVRHYWWKPGNVAPRKRWIEKQIKELENHSHPVRWRYHPGLGAERY